MHVARLKFGIPDIELPCSAGGTVNPASFAGHVLVVLFCPIAAEREAAEVAEYRKLSPELGAYGGWLMFVSGSSSLSERDPPRAVDAACDSDGSAWAAFCEIAPPDLKLDRSEGAAFLFARGGSLQRVWPGRGHAADVLGELARPCSEHQAL